MLQAMRSLLPFQDYRNELENLLNWKIWSQRKDKIPLSPDIEHEGLPYEKVF